jgi:hypothetical protein
VGSIFQDNVFFTGRFTNNAPIEEGLTHGEGEI